jgi:hypothetical protein
MAWIDTRDAPSISRISELCEIPIEARMRAIDNRRLAGFSGNLALQNPSRE